MQVEDESCISRYLNKFRGGNYEPQPLRYSVLYSGFLSTFLMFILLVITNHTAFPMVASSFAASAALLSAAPDSPLSQPRNVIFGHFLGAGIGQSVYHLTMILPDAKIYMPATSAISVGLTISVSMKAGVLHPPAAATAMVASTSSYDEDSYFFIVRPVILGSVVLVACACIINNLSGSRAYPLYW